MVSRFRWDEGGVSRADNADVMLHRQKVLFQWDDTAWSGRNSKIRDADSRFERAGRSPF